MLPEVSRHQQRQCLLDELLASESWEFARDLCAELRSEKPENPTLLLASGQASLQLGDLDAAERYLQGSLALEPGADRAHYFYAHVRRLRGDIDGAIHSLERAIVIAPEVADYWIELGWLACDRRQFDKARLHADRADRLAPACSRAATLSAAVDSELPGRSRGNPAAQLLALEEALALDPNNDAALHNIGVVHFNQTRDLESAERYFRKALSIDPNQPLYQKHLTRTLRHQRLQRCAPLCIAITPILALGAFALVVLS
jgi:tetratricopeptide (TPR) repeat protein